VRAIVDGVFELLDDSAVYRAMSSGENPYGDGRACERIVNALRPAWVAKQGNLDATAKQLETST
jgi:UDP-N-acetylglucosamine 2-epimerase (non-hydrolysing)